MTDENNKQQNTMNTTTIVKKLCGQPGRRNTALLIGLTLTTGFAMLELTSQQAHAASGQRETYKVIQSRDPQSLEVELNSLAAEGWTVRTSAGMGGLILAR